VSTSIVNGIPFDETGADIHVIATNNDDYTADKIAFSELGVTLQRDTIDIVFLPYASVARIYQEI